MPVRIDGTGTITGNTSFSSPQTFTDRVSINNSAYFNFNSTGGGQSSDYWIGRGGVGGGSLAFYAPSSGTLEFGIANDCKFYADSSGQLYHSAAGVGNFLFGSGRNCYYAKGTTNTGINSSGWTDTSLVWSGVYIPAGFKRIFMLFHTTVRANGIAQNHTAFRMKVYNGSTTTYVGNDNWGFGICADVGSSMGGANWNTYCQHVNLYDYDASGNQAGFTAGSTYTMTLQVIDAYANGSNLQLAGEGGGTHGTYTPIHGTIWIL